VFEGHRCTLPIMAPRQELLPLLVLYLILLLGDPWVVSSAANVDVGSHANKDSPWKSSAVANGA